MKEKFILVIIFMLVGLVHGGMDRMDYYVLDDEIDDVGLAETTDDADTIHGRNDDWTDDYDDDVYDPRETRQNAPSRAGNNRDGYIIDDRSDTDLNIFDGNFTDHYDGGHEEPAATGYDVDDNDVGDSYDGEAYDKGDSEYGGVKGASKIHPHSGSRSSKHGHYSNPHYRSYGGHGDIKYVHRNYGPK